MNNKVSFPIKTRPQLLRITLILGAVLFCVVALLQMSTTSLLLAHSSQAKEQSTNEAEASGAIGPLVSFPIKHTITTILTEVNEIDVADVDGDGKLDIIVASLDDEGFTWWKNDDGKGINWIMHTVDGDFSGTRSLQAADIDNDNDYDVVAVVDGAIVWWENDGSPVNGGWTQHSVAEDFNNAWDIYVANMDRDSDMDILGVANNGDVILWENSLGDASPWEAQTIATINEFKTSRPSIYAADMNNDTYLDVLAASSINGIRWWENNDGTLPNDATPWATHIVIDGKFTIVTSIHPAQMNQTGNLPDIVSAYQVSGVDYIGWWENSGPGKWDDPNLDQQFDGGQDVHAVDLDKDGDMDILGVGEEGVAWWENLDGEGSDWNKHELDSTFSEAKVVTAADINGDGYPDILAAGGGTIAWWQLVPDAPELNSIDNADGDANYDVNWSTEQDVITYTLQEDDNPDFSSPISYTTDMQSYPISGQTSGTYYYRVRAENEIGQSPWSNIVSVTAPYLLYLPIVLQAAFPTPTPTATTGPTPTPTYTPEPCLTAEAENNNISADANPICPNKWMDGVIEDYLDINGDPNVDRDYYGPIKLEESATIKVSLDMTKIPPTAGVTYRINVVLRDSSIQDLNNTGGSITYTNVELEANQRYFFRVYRHEGDEHLGPYRLKWELVSP